MNRNILLLIISFLFCSYINGQSHKELVNSALAAKDMTKAEEQLKAWSLADSIDPELYISYSNFYTIKSQEAGLLSTTGYDVNYSKKALEYIAYGIERYPTRFDMYIVKIYLLAKLKDYKSFTSEIIKMIELSDKIKNNWRGIDFETLDNAEKILYGAILEFQGILLKEKLYDNMIQISETTLKYYPRHVQSILDLSTVYFNLNKPDESINLLTIATQIEPENAIVQYNLAYLYSLKGDKTNAKKYYELVVVNAKEEEAVLKNSAQQHLEELK